MSHAWPFPGDSSIVRARKVALAYRELAAQFAPAEKLSEMDARFRRWGEGWMSPVDTFGPDDWVNAKQAGQLAGMSGANVHKLRRNGEIRARYDGRKYLFQVGEVQQLPHREKSIGGWGARRRREAVTVTVHANDTSVSTGPAKSPTTPPKDAA